MIAVLHQRHRACGALMIVACWGLGACSDDTAPSDGRVVRDGGDGSTADTGPTGDHGPLANVYVLNPKLDNGKSTQVKLKDLTDTQGGTLTGKYVKVWSCVRKPSTQTLTVRDGLVATFCSLEQQARRGSDGSYLQIQAPASDIDGESAFAETMVYHHATRAHDFFRGFGLTGVDKQLPIFVNFQAKLSPAELWIGYPNANFMTDGTVMGIELSAGPGLVFGYNNITPEAAKALGFTEGPTYNFAYDASTIYHEYTHFATAGVGDSLGVPDRYGFDYAPMALRESMADYFGATLSNDTDVSYAAGRDLKQPAKCPDVLSGEPHQDGHPAASAMWAARTLLGAEVADRAFLNAVISLPTAATFDIAATAMLDEVKKIAPTQEGAVRKIFEDAGFLGCVRLRDHVDFNATDYGRRQLFYGAYTPFGAGVPNAVQFRVPVAAATQQLTITFTAVTGGTGMLDPASGRPKMSIAMKKGSNPILYTSASSDADAVLVATDKGQDEQEIVVFGSCLAPGGDVVFQFLYGETRPGVVTSVTVTQSTQLPTGTPNFNSCS